MSRATPIGQEKITGLAARKKAIVIIAILAAAFLAIGLLAFGAIFPPSVEITPLDGTIDVPLDNHLRISTSRFRGDIRSIKVLETSLDPVGASIEEKEIAGSLANGIFVPEDGEALFKADRRYDITVEAELRNFSLTGIEKKTVTRTVSFRTIVTPVPLFSAEAQTVEIGKPIVVEFNTPIEKFSYSIEPSMETTMRIDEDSPSRAYIEFEGYEQGLEYTLTISTATAVNGSELPQAVTQKVATTSPLKVVFVPGDGESGVSISERPSLTFTEGIRNPEMADSLLSIVPSTLGTWEWTSADRVEFHPLEEWTQGQEITISLRGGTEAFRGESGSFLREDVSSTFNIKPSKLIDVNLSAQTVSLYENDVLVQTMICSSGSQATPSLTGTYFVYAKAEKLDMRGEGYFAPDVPWVLMFNGDYTIHGNYWATSFGTPSSHGCVGLPVGDAEYLYNWTPIGTIVSIHY